MLAKDFLDASEEGMTTKSSVPTELSKKALWAKEKLEIAMGNYIQYDLASEVFESPTPDFIASDDAVNKFNKLSLSAHKEEFKPPIIPSTSTMEQPIQTLLGQIIRG
jgi:hypothetical protein